VLKTSGTYMWSFVTQIFHNVQPSHGGDRNSFFNLSIGDLVSVASLLAAMHVLVPKFQIPIFSSEM